MVVISEIPLVGKAADRIYDALIDAGIRGMRYVFCYNSLVDNLKSEIKNIEAQEKRVSTRAEAERDNGKIIEDDVTKWQEDVKQSKTRTDGLFTQELTCNCFNVVMLPNPVARFRLGRKAAQETKNVAQLTLSGEKLLANEIAHLPADPNKPICDTTYQKFDSREEAYGKLWEALVKEDGHPIIGIYGMPGVGKTRMMEHAWEDAKNKDVFKKVTRANVGAEKFDVIKLQNQIAGYLGCHLDSEGNEEKRASQLEQSLINGGNTLVVLDDAWYEISLRKIGIPLAGGIPKGCKILLTSRKENICFDNHCKDPIKINPLIDGESWDMFKNTVGTSKIDSLRDKSLAEKVCKKCGGLPLLLQALGKALMSATEDSWKDALSQLNNSDLQYIDGTESTVYNCIKLSFDKLPEAEKICLLFCSLFPEDAEIEIKMLEDFTTGSQLLTRGRIIKGLVDNLKSASLLLEGKTHHTVKLHDIIQDVARSIAARDEQYAFCFIRGGSCFPNNINYRTEKLLQFVESDNFQFPNGMVCPDLHTLWLECNNIPQQFPKSFFEGIGNLKILVFKYMRIFPEHISVQTFNNLNVLILDCCDLNEISLSIVPENLRTLRISECRIPNPLDLSKMKSLRKLQVLCYDEIKMVQYSISTLSHTLEELHIPGGFEIRDAEGKSISMPISSELNKLTALTSLNIWLQDSESCPNENIVGNLLDFIVDVGEVGGVDLTPSNLHTRSVAFQNTAIEGGGKVLVERAEEVKLCNIEGSPFGLGNSNNIEAFSTLKKLSIVFCDDIEHLETRMPHNEIKQSQPLTSFSKLTTLWIESCHGLKYLFSASVVKCLVQLEELYVFYCSKLEVVIRNESASDGVIINFPNLKELTLKSLQSLRSFYGESRADNTSIPPGSDSLFDAMVAFSALETLDIQDLNMSEIWGKNCYNNDSFCQLKCLTIWGCSILEFAIPLDMLPTLQNLEELKIRGCESMTSEVEISSNECTNAESTSVALRTIEFSDMPALTQIRLNSSWRYSYPKLEKLTIQGCKSLRNVFLPSIAGHLKHLEKLYIKNCEIMSEIIGEEEREEDRNYAFDFPELIELQLYSLSNFKSFCFNQSMEASQRHSYSNPKVLFPKLVLLEFNVKTIKLDQIELGRDDSTANITKLVVHCDNKVQLPSTWQLQFPNIEDLSLKNFWWSGNIMEAFSNLKKLYIDSCDDMEHLAFIPRYEIQQRQPLTLFSKLTSLLIVSCSGLKYLFCASVANCLVQLQELRVENCPTLEVVTRSERNGVIPKFPKLKELTLANLESLRSFYGENRDRSSSSTTIIETAAISPAGSESLFNGMVIFPALEKLGIQSLETSEIWGENCYNSFCLLKLLEIESCHNLEFAIRFPMLETLQHLEELTICKCDSTIEVVIRNESTTDEIIIKFPKLKHLRLEELPSLRRFYGGTKVTSSSSTTIMDNATTSSFGSDSLFDEMVEYPALEKLTIGCLKISEIWGTNCCKDNSFCQLKSLVILQCHNLEFAIPLAMLPPFQKLDWLKIWECESMTSEVESSSSSNECLPQLVALDSIMLYNMPGLTQTGLNSRGRNLYPNLKNLFVSNCKSLKSAILYSKAEVLVYLTDAQDEDDE